MEADQRPRPEHEQKALGFKHWVEKEGRKRGIKTSASLLEFQGTLALVDIEGDSREVLKNFAGVISARALKEGGVIEAQFPTRGETFARESLRPIVMHPEKLEDFPLYGYHLDISFH